MSAASSVPSPNETATSMKTKAQTQTQSIKAAKVKGGGGGGGENRAAVIALLQQCDPTEHGNALLFAALHHDNVRFDHGSQSWLIRQKHFWSPDTKAFVYQLMSETTDWRARNAPLLANGDSSPDPKTIKAINAHRGWARQSKSYRVAQNSLAWAEKLPALATDLTKWDADPWVLGTPDGVYDLPSGKLAPTTAVTERYVSLLTSVSPVMKDCPMWRDFLDKATGGDKALQSYLQRLAGYCLTGSTREQSLIWFLGLGGNGKSTFLETLSAILGTYAHTMRAEVLVAAKYEQHSTELCDLKGKRLVVTSETEQAKSWREALLKRLSGSDTITARRVHKDSITFKPTHKLIIAGNHAPQLSSVSEAERRRYQMVHWNYTFKPLDDPTFETGKDIVRDDYFNQKIEAEHGAILHWAMLGAQEWFKEGLKPPDSVLLDSSEFLHEQDLFEEWLQECCERLPGAYAYTTQLFQNWHGWCQARGEFGGTQRAFTERLKQKGCKPDSIGREKKRIIVGLVLTNPDANLVVPELPQPN